MMPGASVLKFRSFRGAMIERNSREQTVCILIFSLTGKCSPVYKVAMRKTLADVLRKRIDSSGESLNAIAKASGVAYSILYRFLSGERDLTLTSAEKVCRYLNLKLTEQDQK